MLFFLLIVPSLSSTCPQYNCHTGGYSTSPTCAHVTPTRNILLEVCEEPSPYCDISGTINQNYTCTSTPPQSSYLAFPGEFCLQNSNCITGLCISLTCIGQNPGGPCVSNSDCSVSLYCGPGFFCIPQQPLGAACTSDYQCLNTLACNNTLFTPGTCINYYSIPSGYVVGTCIDKVTEGVSNLCESGSCYLLNAGFESTGICQPNYRNLDGYPYICEYDAECLGYNEVNTTIGQCNCGMDKDGNAYCEAFTGDPPGISLQSLFKQHLNNSGIFNCHTQRRFDLFCLQQTFNSTNIESYLKSQSLASDTPRYQNNDYCTESIFNSNFFSITPGEFSCQSYSCANTDNWVQDTCVTYTGANNGFVVNPCEPSSVNSFCNVSSLLNSKWNNATCEPVANLTQKLPGALCLNGLDCISGLCLENLCRGLAMDSVCSTSSTCDIGLFCSGQNYRFTCQPLIGPYEMGCGSDYECVNYCGCNFGSSGPPGTCIPYFTLPGNSSVACTNSGISYLCESGACYNPGSSFLGSCTIAPTSTSQIPVLCSTSNTCQGTNGLNQKFQSTCTCGYNTQGNSYCSLFSGDAPGQDYFNIIQEFLSSTTIIINCSSTQRFSKDCFDMVARELGLNPNIWYSKMLNFTNFPLFIGNDECVQGVFTKNFWEAQPPGPHPQPTPPPWDPNPEIIYYGHGNWVVVSLIVLSIS